MELYERCNGPVVNECNFFKDKSIERRSEFVVTGVDNIKTNFIGHIITLYKFGDVTR